MQVAQYTFQSPSTSRIQVGRLDPNSVKEEQSSSSQVLTASPTQEKAENFMASQKQEVKPAVSENSIDLYV